MSEIKLKGAITRCLAVQQGVSQKTGREWMKQSFVLQHESGQHPRYCKFDVLGDKIERFNLQPGDIVTVYLDIDCREYNGNYYNDVTAWRCEREQQPEQPQYIAPQPTSQQGMTIYPEQPQQAATENYTPSQAEQDLPF